MHNDSVIEIETAIPVMDKEADPGVRGYDPVHPWY